MVPSTVSPTPPLAAVDPPTPVRPGHVRRARRSGPGDVRSAGGRRLSEFLLHPPTSRRARGGAIAAGGVLALPLRVSRGAAGDRGVARSTDGGANAGNAVGPAPPLLPLRGPRRRRSRAVVVRGARAPARRRDPDRDPGVPTATGSL